LHFLIFKDSVQRGRLTQATLLPTDHATPYISSV
jgi:hypothetical protein